MSEKKTWDFIKAKFITSAVKPEQYPESASPEVAFLGRSNVGKSSLINSLSRNRHLAKTSGSPGKTRTINFFDLEAKYTEDELPRKQIALVDLPGYGFAKASKGDKKEWSKFIQLYITQSQKLLVLYQLIDIRHDLMANDKECFDWLSSMDISLKIIFTKADKLSQSVAAKQKNKICQALNIQGHDTILYSSVKNTGRQKLIDDIVNRF